MLLVECGPGHLPERQYAVHVVIGCFLGLEYEFVEGSGDDVVIRQAGEDDGRRLSIADSFFGTVPVLLHTGALPQGELAVLPAELAPGARVFGDLPVLYGEPVLTVGEHSIELGLDVFGGAFVMLTRLEEMLPGGRDAHGRFPAGASLASRHGFLDRPIVNEYAEVLWCALQRLWPGLERPARSFRLIPTHDVDWPFYSQGRLVRTVARAVQDQVVRRDSSLTRDRLKSAMAVRRGGRDADSANTFDFMMNECERSGWPGAFYFMTRHAERRFDGDYSIDDPWIGDLIHRVGTRGHEVGLHPSYTAYEDEAALRLELGRLEQACSRAGLHLERVGGRQHYLRWSNPRTWRDWETVGLAYDSTLGFSEAVGFRCGACYEYPAFDLEQRRISRLLERPLIAMEVTLLNYGGASPEATAVEMRRLKEICRAVDGDFTFLWHNNHLRTERNRSAYTSVLQP